MTIETENQKSVKGRIVAAAWQLFYEKGYNGTTVDDIIDLSGTSKGSFYYYFNTKDELLNTLSMILDDNYEILKEKMDPDMNSYDKLLYLNYEAHSMIEEKINIDLLASLYSTQLVAQGHRSLLDQNRTYYKLISSVIDEGQKRGEFLDEVSVSDLVRYYSMCERALVSDWCLNKGEYSLREYSKKCMPVMLEHFNRSKDGKYTEPANGRFLFCRSMHFQSSIASGTEMIIFQYFKRLFIISFSHICNHFF